MVCCSTDLMEEFDSENKEELSDTLILPLSAEDIQPGFTMLLKLNNWSVFFSGKQIQ